ncbi:MAG: DUF4097 family beta strand repeat protein [Acidobacteria bacterium]|nr:DUF4097 family beta strand repeat protein [Acidobacteriota bacterium]
MAFSTRFRVPLAGAAVAVLLSAPACVDIVGADLGKFVDSQEKRFSTNGKPDVDLSTFDGAIEIRSWDRPEVLVVIERRARDKAGADTIEVHTEQNGNRVTVHARVADGTPGWGISWHHNWRSARLIASVPAASNILANSGDGSIDIERVSGTIDLRSGDGSIRARELTGDLKAHTGDGSIKLADVDGSLDIDTGDGSVVVSGKFTTVRARTGDGSVTVEAAPGSAAAADWNITTGDGSVTLALPDGFGGELDAHTGDGRIHMQDISVSNTTGRIGRNTFRGTIGSGGRALRVRTGDGSITLRRF